jgi:hypothetical protein
MARIIKTLFVVFGVVCLLRTCLPAWAQEEDVNCDSKGYCDTNFIPERVGIVDFYQDEASSTTSLVVRGNLPLKVQKDGDKCINPCFAYTDLNDAIKGLPKRTDCYPDYFPDDKKVQLGSVLKDFDLSKYELLVISLIDNGIGEGPSLTRELNAFGLSSSDVYAPCQCSPPIDVYRDSGHFTQSPCTTNKSHVPLGQLARPDGTTRAAQFVWWPFVMWGGCDREPPLSPSDFCCDKYGQCPKCPKDYWRKNDDYTCDDCMPQFGSTWADIPCKDPEQLYTQKGPEGAEHPSYDFPGLIDFIHAKLAEPGKKRVVYFHCIQGTDRTGAVHMGYLLKYYKYYPDQKPMTLSKALLSAHLPVGDKKPCTLALRVVAGYCRWLASSDSELTYTCIYDEKDLENFIDIKANTMDSPFEIPSETPVSITVSLSPGDQENQTADWWLVQLTPLGTFKYYDLSSSSMLEGLFPSHQGPLFTLGTTQILNIPISTVGTHTFYFGVDLEMNGSVDGSSLKHDWVNVYVTEP